MKIAVRYYSRSGNTKKLADAIAAAAGITAEDLSSPLPEKADVLFLGSSVYGGRPDDAVLSFLGENAEKIGRLVSFGSSASGRSTFKKVQEAAGKAGIAVCDEEFICPGSFLFLHKNRPNDEDLAKARAFAEKVIG